MIIIRCSVPKTLENIFIDTFYYRDHVAIYIMLIGKFEILTPNKRLSLRCIWQGHSALRVRLYL